MSLICVGKLRFVMLERDSEMEDVAVEKREKIILKDLWCAVALDK